MIVHELKSICSFLELCEALARPLGAPLRQGHHPLACSLRRATGTAKCRCSSMLPLLLLLRLQQPLHLLLLVLYVPQSELATSACYLWHNHAGRLRLPTLRPCSTGTPQCSAERWRRPLQRRHSHRQVMLKETQALLKRKRQNF